MVNGVAVLFRMPPSWSDGTSSRGSRQDAVVGYVDLQQLMMKIFRVWAEETRANLPAPGLVSSSDDERSRVGEGTLFNEGEGSSDSYSGGDALRTPILRLCTAIVHSGRRSDEVRFG